MQISIQYVILLFTLSYSNFCLGQSKAFYMDRYGDIQTELDYKNQKESAINSAGNYPKDSFLLFENLVELYHKNDSIVYSYNWVLTDNIEETEKEFEILNSMIGEMFPIKEAETLSGSIVDIDDLKGKPTLINLWFTTCAPCIREMPVLNEIKAKNKDRFNFLAITMDSKAKVKRLLKSHNFDFDHIVGSKELTTKLGFRHFPANLFLDKTGRIRIIENSVPVKVTDAGISLVWPHKFLKILETLL